MSENTQLTTASGYDTKRMVFSAAQSGTIPNSVPQINYKRILIQTRNEDGSIGDLILPTSKLFSFGVSENTNPETGKINGYVMPLCLWHRDGPSKEEKDWSDTFDNIVERCKDHLVENREEIEMYELEKRDLKKLNPMYWKREKGKIVEGTGPTLYTKLIVSKKQEKIVTMFFDFEGDVIDPMKILGKYCSAKCAIKIESIFIGNKISLQVKLYECEVKLMDSGMKRLLKRPNAQKRVLTSQTSLPLDEKVQDEPDSDSGSVKNSESENENDDEANISQTEKPSDKKVVKRRVKKIVRKTVPTE